MSSPAVLIVEDDANLREALFDTLNSDTLSVLTADSGPSALDILNTNDVGLVISDLQMEPMDGVTLLGEILYLQGDYRAAQVEVEALLRLGDPAPSVLRMAAELVVLRLGSRGDRVRMVRWPSIWSNRRFSPALIARYRS